MSNGAAARRNGGFGAVDRRRARRRASSVGLQLNTVRGPGSWAARRREHAAWSLYGSSRRPPIYVWALIAGAAAVHLLLVWYVAYHGARHPTQRHKAQLNLEIV